MATQKQFKLTFQVSVIECSSNIEIEDEARAEEVSVYEWAEDHETAAKAFEKKLDWYLNEFRRVQTTSGW